MLSRVGLTLSSEVKLNTGFLLTVDDAQGMYYNGKSTTTNPHLHRMIDNVK